MVALAGATMGTSWAVRYADPRRHPPAAVQAAIEARLADLVAQLSHWEPASALCGFNRAAPGEWIALPPDLARVVDAALRIAQASGGAFDPAIGHLVDLWGFGPPGRRPPPDTAAVTDARARSGYDRLAWDAQGQRLRQPGGIALDLSGIAKGHAADALADLLAGLGIAHALVEVGGELVGRGLRPDGDPWWVELETPPGVDVSPLRLALHQMAVATSGDYRRGEHTLDPRTGRAPKNGVIAASVVADTAMLADALASAATVLYPDLALLDTHGIAARLLVRRGDAVEEVLTPAFAALLA